MAKLTRAEYSRKILEYLHFISDIYRYRKDILNDTSVHHDAEELIHSLYKAIRGYKIHLMQDSYKDCPGIDIYDDRRKQGIQVTIEKDGHNAKIKQTMNGTSKLADDDKFLALFNSGKIKSTEVKHVDIIHVNCNVLTGATAEEKLKGYKENDTEPKSATMNLMGFFRKCIRKKLRDEPKMGKRVLEALEYEVTFLSELGDIYDKLPNMISTPEEFLDLIPFLNVDDKKSYNIPGGVLKRAIELSDYSYEKGYRSGWEMTSKSMPNDVHYSRYMKGFKDGFKAMREKAIRETVEQIPYMDDFMEELVKGSKEELRKQLKDMDGRIAIATCYENHIMANKVMDKLVESRKIN